MPGRQDGERAVRTTPSPTLLVALSLLLIAGCGRQGNWTLPGQPDPNLQEEKFGDQVLDFDTLYKHNCTGCHGADGTMGPAPPLNDAVFQAVVSEDDLRDVIRNGRRLKGGQKTPMPAFDRDSGGPLAKGQIDALVEGFRKHKKKDWALPATPTPDPPPYSPLWWEPPGNKEDGAMVFQMACAGCHGPDGKREGVRINDQAFIDLISDQALRRYAITGRPDFGMPNYAGKGKDNGRSDHFQPLTARDVTHLTAYLASWRSPKVSGR